MASFESDIVIDYVFKEYGTYLYPHLSFEYANGERGSSLAEDILLVGREYACWKLASHPKFDILALLIHMRHWLQWSNRITKRVEILIAIVIPPSQKRMSIMAYEYCYQPIEICKRYFKDAQKTHKEMHNKHFGFIKSCQVFCFILLIENKIWSI